MIDRAIGIAGLGVSIIFGLLMVVFPNMSRKIGVAGMAVGLLLLVAAGGLALLPEGNAQSPPVINQCPGSAFSFGQQGGITAGTVNIAPGKRSLSQPRTDKLKEQLLGLPKDKELLVTSLMGDAEAFDFAVEIYDFLKANGLKMRDTGVGQAVYSRPFHGIGRNDDQKGEFVELQVGPE